MSSTSPDPDTEAAPVAGNDDSAAKYLDGVSGDAEGFEAESPQARQAKAEALAHARAARAARAKYARLVSQQAGVPNRNPNNKMQAESFSDMVAAQGDRIGGAEMSLVVTRVVDQLHSSFAEVREMPPAAKAGVAGLAAWVPLLLLRPAKRGHGVGGFVSDPRVWSFGALALVALGEIVDTNARLKRDGDQVKAKVPEKVSEISDRPAMRQERSGGPRQTAVSTTPKGKSP